MPNRPLRHAVVAGGSIGGLFAARVLSKHFERVTVVEPDRISGTPEPRKGVPQGRHVHTLLPRGKIILEALFPGLEEELCAAGAVRAGTERGFAWHYKGAWRARFRSELSILSVTRPLLEATIARRVRRLQNVHFLDGARVSGLLFDDGRTVRGVHVEARGEPRTVAALQADLVVDAAGRGSLTPQWLAEAGFEAPATELVPARVTYSTCTFRQREPLPEWRSLVVGGAPARRGCFAFAVEGSRWLVSLASFFDEPAPDDHGSFLAHAQSLPVPDLYGAIRQSEPLSEIVHYRFPGSQRRRYETIARFPEGLIALGDAVCSFNPVYGQGMTLSAIEAEVLEGLLARARDAGGIDHEFGRRWFRGIGSAVDLAWNGVLLEDLQFPELRDRRPFRLRALHWYMSRVHHATYSWPEVTEQFYRVTSFLDPPRALFRTTMLRRVLLGP